MKKCIISEIYYTSKLFKYFQGQSKENWQIQKYPVSKKYVYLYSQYLVDAPLPQITASVRRGMQAISLCYCWGVIEAAFSSSIFLDRYFLIFLLTTPHRFPMGFKSGKLDGQSSAVISWISWLLAYNISKPFGSSFSTLGRCWDPLEMEIGICQWQASSALKYPSRQLLDFGLNKTQWTNTHR